MMIGHVPAGYLLTVALLKRCRVQVKYGLWCGLVASVLPDVDMIWFYIVDHGRFHHHSYWLHLPILWLAIGLFLYGLDWVFNRHKAMGYITIIMANITLHLLLDTIAGGIAWLTPFSTHLYHLVEVPRHSHGWIVAFIFHWTFLLEILMIVAAVTVWMQRCKKPS